MNEYDYEYIRQLVRERDLARAHAEEADERLRAALRDAIRRGVSVIALAKVTGLTRARIYQIRDDRR